MAVPRSTGLVEVLDRVLDKGLFVGGDIKISLAEVELLTIRIRLIVCSLDLVDAAYLVREARVPAFRRSLSTLSRDLRAHGCRVIITGPWPPYSFVEAGDEAHG